MRIAQESFVSAATIAAVTCVSCVTSIKAIDDEFIAFLEHHITAVDCVAPMPLFWLVASRTGRLEEQKQQHKKGKKSLLLHGVSCAFWVDRKHSTVGRAHELVRACAKAIPSIAVTHV